MLRLEQAQEANAVEDSEATIREAVREAHSLKGSALMLGFTDISQVSHQLEDLFVAGRRSPSLLDGDAFDLVFGAVDMLSVRIEQLAKGNSEPVEIGELSRQLTATVARFQALEAARTGADPLPRSPAGPDAVRSPETAPRGRETRQSLRVPMEKLDRLTHLAPEMVVQARRRSSVTQSCAESSACSAI